MRSVSEAPILGEPGRVTPERMEEIALELESDLFKEDRELAGRRALNKVHRTVMLSLIAVVALFIVYQLGFLTTGAARRHAVWNSGFSSWSRGWSMGSRQVYARAGQTIVVDYDATIARGNFYVWVRRQKWGLSDGIDGQVRLHTSGKGALRVPIQQNGLYRIIFDGSPGGNGYDVDYTVRWRVE